jgi:ferredoxin
VGVRTGDTVVIDVDGLNALIGSLRDRGMRTLGPTVRDGAIVPGEVRGTDDLPRGWHDDQAPGRYRLVHGDDPALFGWAVGPGSWKAELLPPSRPVWRARVEEGGVTVEETGLEPKPTAFIGARPCELAALDVLDRVLAGGAVPDPFYESQRAATLVVAAECGTPSGTCFCTSMGTGPGAESGFDLALTELPGPPGHRFLVRVGSDAGAEALAGIDCSPAEEADRAARSEVVGAAASGIARRLDTKGLPALLARNLDHPRWDEVAERCLACGNCTLVCPTCFCSDVHDVTDVSGTVERRREWASCFDLAYSTLHSGPVRASTASRYRQWLTHKLSTWWDQFDTSGCVGCGRCITWCPVGIDITEEAAAIRATDGAGDDARVGAPRGPSFPGAVP